MQTNPDKQALEELADRRAPVNPKWHSYRELPEHDEDRVPLFQEMARIQAADGAKWLRFTIVSDDYPKPPYPHGLYVEGWVEKMGPTTKEAPFSYPLRARTEQENSHAGGAA